MKPPMNPPLVESEISQITPWERIQRRRQPNEQEAGQRNFNNKQHYLTSRRHKLGSRGNNQSTLLQCWGFEERDIAQRYINAAVVCTDMQTELHAKHALTVPERL